MSSLPPLCLYCGQRAGIIWVHGHGQCAHCKVNVDECCRGETAQLPSASPDLSLRGGA